VEDSADGCDVMADGNFSIYFEIFGHFKNSGIFGNVANTSNGSRYITI
jgi:hypothetical protein